MSFGRRVVHSSSPERRGFRPGCPTVHRCEGMAVAVVGTEWTRPVVGGPTLSSLVRDRSSSLSVRSTGAKPTKRERGMSTALAQARAAYTTHMHCTCCTAHASHTAPTAGGRGACDPDDPRKVACATDAARPHRQRRAARRAGDWPLSPNSRSRSRSRICGPTPTSTPPPTPNPSPNPHCSCCALCVSTGCTQTRWRSASAACSRGRPPSSPTRCACTVHVQCLCSACAVHVQCMCSVRAVHVQCMCSACAVHV